ncbi:hypothetical protein FKM82_021264 [Ascaphus truei]
MNGKWPSTHETAIISTWSCPMVSAMPQPSSKSSSTRSSGIFLISSLLSTWDDIMIFSKSLQEHIGHVKQVLLHLRENQLFTKLEKFQFHQTSTAFLGSPAKVKAVLDWLCALLHLRPYNIF